MQDIEYSEEALKSSEKELRRLVIVGIYNSTQENKQAILKALFVQLEIFKKLYAKKLMQKP